MTNILSLPQFSAASFTIANNAAWLDSIYFAAPGYPPPVVINGCSTTVGSNVATVPTIVSTAGVSVGMQISAAPKSFPAASYVGAILSATTFTLVDPFGNAINAVATNAEIAITFNPPPLDISGISFVANLRSSPGGAQVFLVAQTGNGTITNSGRLGIMAFNVPRITMLAIPAGLYYMGLLAVDPNLPNGTVELFTNPALVTINAGIADARTLTGITVP